MTFLNPFVLIGLAAASIPILLHLFNLRKLQKIEFSTLTFLKELQKTKIRRLKLRQLLLLFLRTMIVVLVVTAFSRPTLRTSYFGGLNSQAKSTAIFIIDNSFSMTSVDGEGQLLKQAKDEASGILQLMRDGDEVYVIRSSDDNYGSAIRNFAAARAEIRGIEPSFLHGTIERSLRLAANLLSSSKNLNKEVYVFSDFKMGGLRSDLHQEEAENIYPDGARVFLLPIGKKNRENLTIESLNIENSLFGVGNPFTIKVKVNNWGMQDQKNSVVSVFVNGKRVAQKALDIQAQGNTETEFALTPTSTGYQDGMVELQDDDLEFDNQRAFVVNIPEYLKILLVGNPSDLRYVKLALSARTVQGESPLKLSAVTVDRLTTNDIESADVIVFTNVRQLSSTLSSQVRSFLESGGGVVLFPGASTDSASFQSVWTKTLNLPPISSVESVRTQPGSQTSLPGFDRIDFRHPVFEGMFSEELLNRGSFGSARNNERHIESPAISTHVRFQPNVQSIPIITLSDGTAFMLEQRVKRGIVILFSVSAEIDWSDFPLKGIFVPLIHSSSVYAAQQQSTAPQFTVGQEADVSLKNITGDRVIVQNPNNVEVASNVVRSSGSTALRFQETTMPGIYSVTSDNTIVKQFVVNLDPMESNTVRAGTRVIESLMQHLGIPMNAVRTIDNKIDIQKTVVQSRVGIELWKYFIGAALLVGLIESVVARTTKRESSHEDFASRTASNAIS